MRSITWLRAAASVGLVASIAGSVACGPSDDCNDLGTCGPYDGAGGSSSSGPGTGGTSGNGGDGGGGGTPVGCVPSEAPDAVKDDCGVFVSSSQGDDMGAGSKAKPFKSIGAALAAGKAKRIYVCAEATPYKEALAITADVEIYGGLDCANAWKYDAAKPSALAGAANAPAVRVDGAVSVRLEDLSITAPTATSPGKDSVALWANGADLVLARVALSAGDGAPGDAGEDGGAQDPVDSAMNGTQGAPAGSVPGNVLGGTNNCGAPLAAGAGGLGGNKTAVDKSGASGGPGDGGMGGPGGPGQILVPPFDCGNGTNGGGGANGGPGGGGKGLGELTESGVIGRDGQAGMTGTNGKSGGGGGGSAATATVHGAGGGGGGAGGCAGKSGGGGKAGGSSIALVAVGGTLSLDTVTLKVGKGAVGGKGGAGQFGQTGGQPGPGGGDGGLGPAPGCSGGGGGKGGAGGNAGGGAGGHAIGLAHAGTRVTGSPTVMLGGAMAGDGGDGGDNGLPPGAGGKGEAGKMAEVQPL